MRGAQPSADSDMALALKLQQQFDEEAKSGAKPNTNSTSAYPGARQPVRGPDTSRDEELARALQEEENQKSEPESD